MKTKLPVISNLTLRLNRFFRHENQVFDTVGIPVEMPPKPHRPVDGATLVFIAPLGTAVLLAGIRQPIQDAAAESPTGMLFVGVAVALLAVQCVLAVRAGILALRGSKRGVDLTATALVLALAACISLFLAGIHPDELGWGLGMLAVLAVGLFRLDANTANAWYSESAPAAAE